MGKKKTTTTPASTTVGNEPWEAELDPDAIERWTEPAPCRNEECPHGRPMVRSFAGFGQTIPQLCPDCAAAEQALEEELARSIATAKAVESVMRGVRDPLRSRSLDTFPADTLASASALEDARSWVEEIAAGAAPHDFLLFGKVGRGKTGLAWGIARELAERHGIAATFVNFREMLEQLRESYDDPNVRPDLRHLRAVPVLVLDDLGAERPTEWALEQLASLVDYRNGRSWTIYTSNYSLPELQERLGHDDPIVGQRIVSRIAQATSGRELRGKDRRAA